MDEGWQANGTSLVRQMLIASGHARLDNVDALVSMLIDGGWLVADNYYVPPVSELYGLYARLSDARIRDFMPVRWVMCAETYDALAVRLGVKKYASFSEDAFRTAIDGDGRALGPNTLFGIPIRIDPAARRPMFEVVGGTVDE